MNNETKFTPGPWTVSEYTNYDGWSVFADVIGCVAERWPAYTMSEDQKTEAHANARLIAAAPELYEALKSAREFIEDQQLPDSEWSRVLDIVVAALATVEQP